MAVKIDKNGNVSISSSSGSLTLPATSFFGIGGQTSLSTAKAAADSSPVKITGLPKTTLGYTLGNTTPTFMDLLTPFKSPSSTTSTASSVAAASSAPASSGYTSVPSGGGTSVAVPDYLNADLAKAYGMNATTAYQEALSNTSYQRAVKDLQAAGLNPALLYGAPTPASGVYGASLVSDGVSSGVSSASSAHKWYKTLSNIGTLVGAGSAALFGGNASTIATAGKIGSSVGGALGNLFDSF